MSGGYFDYNCYNISHFAEDLLREIKVNNSKTKDDFDDVIGCFFDDKTIDILKKSQKIIELAGKLAHDIEWLYSGDSSEDIFLEKHKENFELYNDVNIKE